MVEPASRFEELKLPLPEPQHGLTEVSAVLGIPRWWPTGSRVSVVLAHGHSGDFSDPVVEYLHRELTERRYLCLRFNFPFAEAGRKRPDPLPVLKRTFRAAVATLARDPSAAPAHLFVGGKGLGGQVAADLSGSRVRVDGLFLLGFPLHPQDKPDRAQADELYRVISPLLFLQGTRDRHCDLETLRGMLLRVGAPTHLHAVEEADRNFRVTKKSGRTGDEVLEELLNAIDAWIQKVLGA